MNETLIKKEKRARRHKRIRAKVGGTSERPRLAVHKTNAALQAQLIDDERGVTLLAVVTDVKAKKPMNEKAHDAGKKLAEEAKKKGVETVVFDRGGFLYIGNIKAFAEGAREGGLAF